MAESSKKKKKGLGGLSPEKKKMLKKLIMQKAAEDLRNEAKRKAEERDHHISKECGPLPSMEMLGQGELKGLVEKLHKKISSLEEEVYDWEQKIRNQDFEINELTLKVNDAKGKFIKPVLRKVNKTESKLSKLKRGGDKSDFRSTLKSTGKSKYALDEPDDEEDNKSKHDEAEAEAEAEEVAAEDE